MCKEKCQIISTPVTTNYTTTRTRVTYDANDGSGNSYTWNCNGNDNCGYCPNMGTNFSNCNTNYNDNNNCFPGNNGYSSDNGYSYDNGDGCGTPGCNSCTTGGSDGMNGMNGNFGQILQLLLSLLMGGGNNNGGNNFSFGF